MLHKTFKYKKDCNGAVGWIEVGAPACYNSGTGMLVAHDVLEHFKPTTYSKDSWEDELLALGAMVYVRGEQGYFHSMYHPDWKKHLESDISMVLEFVSTTRKLKPCRSRDVYSTREDMYDVVFNAWKYLDTEYIVPTDQLNLITHYLVKGYNLANRRYHDAGYVICDMFLQIEEEVNSLSKYAETGDLLKINVNIKRKEVHFKHIPYWEIEV